MNQTNSEAVTGAGNAQCKIHNEVRLIGDLWGVYQMTSDGHFWGDQLIGNRRFMLKTQADTYFDSTKGA